ncbi:Uncharacterised protein [Neisseria zoodegmatis]|uniref:Uncharacterized protein n=1 Tax=Neisseria zoodegmatis TaxID=326523 RepID=A0AB38DPV1_9NEIS|nr:Uncharacterised protein [Neisseria zoodegmatis]
MRRITAARLLRMISGSVKAGQTFARVLDGQGGHDNEYFRHTVVLLRRQQNAGDLRVDGQTRHLLAELG